MFFVSKIKSSPTHSLRRGHFTENERGVICCRPKSDVTIAGMALADRLFRHVGLETTRFCE